MSGVKGLTGKFEQMGGHSEPQNKLVEDLSNLAKTHETTHIFHPDIRTVSSHYTIAEGRPTGIGEHVNLVPHPTGPNKDPQAWLAEHEQRLGQHQQILDTHKEGLFLQKTAIEKGLSDVEQHGSKLGQHQQILDAHREALLEQQAAIKQALYDGGVHRQRLETLEAGQKDLQENPGQNSNGMSKSSKWALYGLSAAALSAVGTSIATQHVTSNHISDMADRIQAQEDEIRRLKGLNGQQGITMPGQGAVMANGRGASDGGLV